MNIEFFEDLRKLMLKHKIISIVSPLNAESGMEMTSDGRLSCTGFTINSDTENNYFIEGVK